ncbi:MAG: hypothetical protein WC839_01900 [Candidatus Paceibacterota bacterium]
MYTTNTFNSTNPLLEDSVLGSKFLDPNYLFSQGQIFLNLLLTEKNLGYFYILLSFLAIFFIAIIIYVTIRMFEIRKKEHAHLHHEIEEYKHNQSLKTEKTGQVIFKDIRWKKVLDYLFSTNENDWKLAIIEADSMLFDLLTKLKFKGKNIGDKLKEANRDSFHSLSSAWEIHNIRNKIAHESSSFELSLHEAKRVISLYEQIFKEFDFI